MRRVRSVARRLLKLGWKPPATTQRLRGRAALAFEAGGALETEIRLRASDLRALERAREAVRQGPLLGCDAADKRCSGGLAAGWCRGCGRVEVRCAVHGGHAEVVRAITEHAHHEHGRTYVSGKEESMQISETLDGLAASATSGEPRRGALTDGARSEIDSRSKGQPPAFSAYGEGVGDSVKPDDGGADGEG